MNERLNAVVSPAAVGISLFLPAVSYWMQRFLKRQGPRLGTRLGKYNVLMIVDISCRAYRTTFSRWALMLIWIVM